MVIGHPIADAHPGNLDAIVFPGQDYNNARIYDFVDVDKWEDNKLDRTKSSRMGWSDVSLSLDGPIVESLVQHFTERWWCPNCTVPPVRLLTAPRNFIFDEKYSTKDPGKYQRFGSKAVEEEGQSEGVFGGSGDFFGGMEERFNRGLKKLMDYGESQSREMPEGAQATIQLTRR
jgi:phospholipase D1/2